jgi:hypothetical protein
VVAAEPAVTVRSAPRLAWTPRAAPGITTLRHRLHAIERVVIRMPANGALTVMPVDTHRESALVLVLAPSPVAGESD